MLIRINHSGVCWKHCYLVMMYFNDGLIKIILILRVAKPSPLDYHHLFILASIMSANLILSKIHIYILYNITLDSQMSVK